MTRTTFAAVLLVTLVSALLTAFPGAAVTDDGRSGPLAGPDCAPEVAEALNAAAVVGVRRDIATIRSDVTGIRQPQRLADFTCLDRLLDFGQLDVHADIDGLLDRILGTITNRVCNAAAHMHAEMISQPVSSTLYDQFARLPGATVSGRGQ